MSPYDHLDQSQPSGTTRELKDIKNKLLSSDVNENRCLLDLGFGSDISFIKMPKMLGCLIEHFCIDLSRKYFLAWRSENAFMPSIGRHNLAV